MGWGHNPVCKVLALQASGPEFDSQNPHENARHSQATHTLVIPALGNQRQMDPWCSILTYLGSSRSLRDL